MNVSVEIPALEDIERARAWYAAREVDAQDDLSARFEEAVAEAVMRVREAPASYAIVYRNARRIIIALPTVPKVPGPENFQDGAMKVVNASNPSISIPSRYPEGKGMRRVV